MQPYRAGFSVEDSQIFNINPAGVVAPLFVNQVPRWDIPGGGWDIAAGTWTAPANGIYSFNVILQLQALDVPGNDVYELALRLYRNEILVYEAANSSSDQFGASVSVAFAGQLKLDDVIRAEAYLHDANKTTTVEGVANMSFALIGDLGITV
jgi:hypothetical protein